MISYDTITNPCGTGFSIPLSALFRTILFDVILMEPETHSKKFEKSPAEIVFMISTFLVILLSGSILTFAPAAQAIIFPISAFLTASTALLKASVSVGEPSVSINTNGRQSPLWKY